ncbi:hypothetical protein HDU96_005155 [Phlyctochytrium bullatum]|nr:hypothetical protein HDU96_005155 [Phlyctochytrium bullatum]
MTASTATTYHDVYATAIRNVHKAIRFALDSILKNIDTFPENDLDNFRGYVSATLHYIIRHHIHEDACISPLMSTRLDMTEIEDDHKLLEGLVEEIEALLVDPPSKDVKVDRPKVKEHVQKLRDLVVPHMEKEEVVMSVKWLKANIKEEDLKAADMKVHAMVKKEDPTIVIPFLRLHLDQQGIKEFWKPRIPLFIRVLSFCLLEPKHRRWWKYAPKP